MFSVMDIACFHKSKNNTLFHFQDVTENCNIAVSVLVGLGFFLCFLKLLCISYVWDNADPFVNI